MMLQWRPELELPPEVRDFCRRLRQNDPTLKGHELVGKGVDANGAKEIAAALMINKNLTYLNLGGNQIGDEGAKAIAEALMINTNLKILYLDDNRIGVEGANAIATALAAKKRPNLQWISIYADCDDSTAKVFVRAIKDQKFPSLNFLPGLVQLNKHLSELQVPQEFVNKDNREILSFLRERWESGEERLSVVKVVVTGPGSVGKTCLVTRLVQNRFHENTQMTNGVDVVRFVDDNGIEYVYYDFGGQPVYATTHQLFLRTRAVFVVVWDVRSETLDFEHQPFHQYAQDILDASPEAKMIFVSTKSDQGCTRLTSDELHKLETMYQGHFFGYHHISARANSGIDGPDGLKQEITQAATLVLQRLGGEHGLEGMVVPKTWIDLKEKLGILRDKCFLSANEWDSLVQSVNIVEEERADRVLRLFHEMGEVHCLPTGQIVIDPPRLTDVLSRVVTKDQRYAENARDGYLRHKELGQVWGDWDEELHKGFLELLHECEIGYRIRDDDGTDYEATLIPAMLYRDGETMTQHVNSLASTNIELKKGPTLKVELSTRSTRFGPKLLAKLRGVTIIGGWWRNGCIVVDTGDTRDVRAFGTVSWAVDAGVMVVTILTYGAGRLLTLKALNALGCCLEEFPGVHLEGFDMHCGFAGCSGGWSKENILSCDNDTMSCSKCGRRCEVIDVKGWIMTMPTAPSVANSVSVKSGKEELMNSILESAEAIAEPSPSSSAVDDEDVRQLEEDAFAWLTGGFGNWPGRQRLQTVLDELPVTNPMADAVKDGLKIRMSQSVSDYDFKDFFPRFIVSYSTGNRKGKDVDCAGPGLFVVVGLIVHLLDNGYHCYSDILTPGGRNWKEYMDRIEKAQVMIVLMTRTFFRSVHCLREVAAAIRNGVELIPVRCEECSVNGIDIARDRDEMWPLEELAKYAKHQTDKMVVLGDLNQERDDAVDMLATISSIPPHGTLVSGKTAVDELLRRVNDFVPCKATCAQEEQSLPMKKKARTHHG